MSTPFDPGRRRFLGTSALLGTGALADALGEPTLFGPTEGRILPSRRPDAPYPLNEAEQIIYSTCMNCNTGCGVKVKLQDGVVAKVDGSPFSPWTMVPHLPMQTTVDDAAHVDAGLCPKGQAAVQTVYDPYRIRRVLKRAGKRGAQEWVSIPFDQAVSEIVEGGRLFADVPGEEQREVEGLRSMFVVRDAAVAKAMAVDSAAVAAGKMTLSAFQTKHRAHLDKLIDPEHPDLGPRNNHFVIGWGRLKGGRNDFIKRFGAGFGTTNLHGHTTVCQGSLYFTCKAMSEQYVDGKFTGGQKFYWQTDLEGAEYVLFVGANLFEANYGPTNRSVRLAQRLAEGKTRIAVADPRFSVLASKADTWLPVKPGEDTALAFAVLRWMFDQERYDARFLGAANRAAADAIGEPSWSNASWLVATGDDGPGAFVRAATLGLTSDPHALVVLQNGRPVPVDPNDPKRAVHGDLFVATTLRDRQGKPVRVTTGLSLLREEAGGRSFDDWCALAGVPAKDVAHVARELTSHGKRASVELHRGPAQHTDGFYAVLAWMSVNLLLGNVDWKGGLSKPTTYAYDGAKAGPFDLTGVPGSIPAWGVNSIRSSISYEKTTIFAGYPARRNWYPLASDVYQELIPSIGDAYPYPVKALFLYMGTPVYALPAGHTNIEVLADVEKLPLLFASDITVGTTTMYADYIFPDLTWLERWEFQGSHPNIIAKVGPIRQPTVAPVPETVRVYGEETPIGLESLLMAIAERLELPAFGRDALGPGRDFTRPEHFYLRAVANLAAGSGPTDAVPDADAHEIEVFMAARRHLPPAVFDAERWRNTVGAELWPKVVYLLNRGGRFQDHSRVFDGEQLRNRYGALLCLYQEKTAAERYAGTGKRYAGYARYVGQRDYLGQPLDALAKGYDLQLITNRVITQTKSRTVGNYWLTAILPENAFLLNKVDADRLGLSDGDVVKVISATNLEGVWDLRNGTRKPMLGKVKVTQGIRPGVVTFALGFGHWATGAGDITVDGDLIAGDPRRAAGVHANAAMWSDPTLRNSSCLIDPVGGSVSFYDTRVRLVRA